MIRRAFWFCAALVALGVNAAPAQPAELPLVRRSWYETRSAHFNVYSCGSQSMVNALITRLEQFSEAYIQLAGAQAVSSPPIIVMAFPDEDSMEPFLPLYKGKPASIAAFFKRGSDENLIVLSLPSTNSAFSGMEIIFHEYSHLLFRRNANLWPLWLTEGMAEVYSTFDTTGFTVVIGRPIEPYLRLLLRQPLLPLQELFAVDEKSPQYNESERQGMFYAQSWLLTHYLVAGGALVYRTRFQQFTRLLRAGQLPEQAFTNALQVSLRGMEAELDRYLKRDKFTPLQWTVPKSVASGKTMTIRTLTPVEVYFRLGSELVRIDRLDTAETYFTRAQKLAPASPLPYEGLGLLASVRDRHTEAVTQLKEAIQRGSTSFLAHHLYAQEKFRLTGDAEDRYSTLPKLQAAEIRAAYEKSISLMPSFGPAYEGLGFLEMVQGEDLDEAEQHLQLAVQLEPENPSYLFSLAQAQLDNRKPDAARATLEPLLLPGVEPRLRKRAETLLKEINSQR